MLLICNESASPLDDLDFEWFGQMELTSSQGGKRRTQASDLFGPKILEGHISSRSRHSEGPPYPAAMTSLNNASTAAWPLTSLS